MATPNAIIDAENAVNDTAAKALESLETIVIKPVNAVIAATPFQIIPGSTRANVAMTPAIVSIAIANGIIDNENNVNGPGLKISAALDTNNIKADNLIDDTIRYQMTLMEQIAHRQRHNQICKHVENPQGSTVQDITPYNTNECNVILAFFFRSVNEKKDKIPLLIEEVK
jgi:hypothetical protein